MNARASKGHTQEEAAKEMGVHSQTVVGVESGRIRKPFVGTRARLAKYIGVDPLSLMSNESAPSLPANGATEQTSHLESGDDQPITAPSSASNETPRS